LESYIVSAFLKLVICGIEAAARTYKRVAPVPQTVNIPELLMVDAHWLLNCWSQPLGKRRSELWFVVSIHEEYTTVPVEREDTQHQYGWLFEISST